MHEDLHSYLLIVGVVQFLLVSFIIYKLSTGGRAVVGRQWLVYAFVLYLIHLLFFTGEHATRLGLVYLINPETLSVFHHLFFTLLFIAFGYGLIDVLITQPLQKRILRHSTYLIVSVLTVISLVIILVEGKELEFTHAGMEFIYEMLQAATNLLIIVILYNSWKDTGSRKLLLDTIAITLFFLGNTGHILTHIISTTLPVHLEFTLVKYVLATLALLIFAYMPTHPSQGSTSTN